ncbi:MAG: YcxB family protein [Bacilli bacterium]
MDRIIVKGKFDKKINKKYYRFHAFHKSISIYMVILLGIAVLYMAISTTVRANEEISSTTIIFTWVLASFTFLFAPVLMLMGINRNVSKESKIREDSVETVIITKAKIERKIEGKEGSLVFGWTTIDAAYEMEDMFLLYVNKDAAIVLGKEYFIEGDNETLRKMINYCMVPGKKGKIKFKSYLKKNKKNHKEITNNMEKLND